MSKTIGDKNGFCSIIITFNNNLASKLESPLSTNELASAVGMGI
jgi:hypothetical protein